MSLLADTPVPPECRALLHDLVDAVPQNELLTYAATGEAFLGGGFRKNNIAVVRSRIRQVLDAQEAVDAPLRRLLARHDPCASCLALLSEEFLKANRDHLEALFGRPAPSQGRDSQLAAPPLRGRDPPFTKPSPHFSPPWARKAPKPPRRRPPPPAPSASCARN